MRLGERVLDVEIAATPESRRQGLMGRTALAPGTGMLFIFPEPQRLQFWMKNTKIPLSIGFFNQNRELTEIFDLEPESDSSAPPRCQSSSPSQYALEVPRGWFEENRIVPGVSFQMESSFPDPESPLK
jgi:uncharacterized membrane protein (UPF0127 family)